jgi:L-lactate dehydrogenase complex protein LldG
MDAREQILTAVDEHRPPSRALPEIPDFRRRADGLTGLFTEALGRLDGTSVSEPPGDLQRWLSQTFPDASRICSAVPELAGTITPAEFSDWSAPADLDVTLVRSPLGVAETGSILLTETELEVDTIAVLPRHLVVLLDPDDIVEDIHAAYRHPSFQQAAYAVLLSGPSGSADIGGITVHPAQGVATLTVILSPRNPQGEVTTTTDPAHSRVITTGAPNGPHHL